MSDMPERIWTVYWGTDGAVMNGAWADTVRHFGGGVEYIRADLAAPRWFSIDDPDNQPPKDGTEILAAVGSSYQGGVVVVTWAEWVGAWLDNDGDNWEPTHWQPMPEPPK